VYFESGYWDDRYQGGRSSGVGSEGDEAEWKRALIEFVIETYEIESILDLGCGDGQLMFPILKERQDLKYTGVDISEFIINKNREVDGFKSEVEFECADIVEGFQTFKSFDLVIMMDVLFHASSDYRHEMAIRTMLQSFNRVALFSYWNEGADHKHAEHCFYRPVEIPEGFKVTAVGVPNVAIKDVAIVEHD
jgi:SAM-dependent methyltransferase